MKAFIPALLIFLLAFIGLSIGILFGRKGISGSCSSTEGRLADLKCTCGRDEDSSAPSCDNIAVEVICPDENPEEYQQLLKELDSRENRLKL
jgi:hypothetical protein